MSGFQSAIAQKSWVVTATLPLFPNTTAQSIEDALEPITSFVDAVQLIDNRDTLGHLSPLAAASIVKMCGVDPMMHLTCRDRNRVALQADLLGAAAIGVTSLLLSRGEKLKDSKTLRGKGVFDIRAAALTKMAHIVGEDRHLMADPGWMIGAPVTVFKPTDDWEASRVVTRIDSGARFLQSQPCLDADLLKTYLQALIARKILRRASFIVDVPLFTSAATMRSYKAKLPGALLPPAAMERITKAADEKIEGIALCVEMLHSARWIPGVAGVNVHYGGDTRDVAAVLHAAGTA